MPEPRKSSVKSTRRCRSIRRFARQTDRRGVDVLLFPFPECFRVRFGINICYDAQFPAAAASVAAQTAKLLLVPAQNLMRRAATRWKDEHHRIRCERAPETGMWLVSADVTGARDAHRVGYGPTSVINPCGEVVAQAPMNLFRAPSRAEVDHVGG